MQPRLSHQAQRFGRKGRAAAIAALLAAISLPQLPAQAAGAADPASAMEPARDEALSYAIGLQAYIDAFPMMDLYRTLWETSFDPGRGYDRTLNEFFVFDSLVTSADDWVVTPNEDTIYLRAFLDLRAEPVILVIPPSDGRKYWIPVGDMRHDISANLSWDTIGAQGGAFALVGPGWQGVLPDGVKRIDVGTPIAWTLPRFAVNGAADLPSAVAMQKRVRLVPLNRTIFPDGRLALELDLSGFMRGDPEARWQAHAVALDKGVLTPNEVRDLEGWGPLPAGTTAAGEA